MSDGREAGPGPVSDSGSSVSSVSSESLASLSPPASSTSPASSISGESTSDRVAGSPAPGYGEYAPAGWVSPVPTAPETAPADADGAATGAAESPRPHSVVATDTRPSEAWRSVDAPPPTGDPVPGPPPPPRRDRPYNRSATLMLLGYGLYSVISGAVSVGSFATSKILVLGRIGYPVDHFSRTGALQTVGDVSAIASFALFLVVALWSLRRLRAGKNSWAPLLITGLAANLVTSMAAVAVLFSDPGLSASIYGG